jgi:hypothetical protein
MPNFGPTKLGSRTCRHVTTVTRKEIRAYKLDEFSFCDVPGISGLYSISQSSSPPPAPVENLIRTSDLLHMDNIWGTGSSCIVFVFLL